MLRAHEDGPLTSRELEKSNGWAAETSLRAAADNLRAVGALGRVSHEYASRHAGTELTVSGRGLLPVIDVLERWLGQGPDGPFALDDPAARAVIKAVTAAWDSRMVATLAERPHALNDLSASIHNVSYPSLKRRLSKLSSTYLVAPVANGRSAVYEATDWLRRSTAPLIAALRWELEHDPDAPPISRFEVEATFLLTLPLARIPKRGSGCCTFAVVLPAEEGSGKPQVSAVAAQVERGLLLSCRPGHVPKPDTWAFGSASSWLAALADGNLDGLRVNGKPTGLIKGIVKGMSRALYD